MEEIPLTEQEKELLYRIPLFRELPMNIKQILTDKLDFTLRSFSQGERVATQGNPCNHLYVLLRGKLRVDFIGEFGNEVVVENIVAPRAFATPHLFGPDNHLPASFTALVDSQLFMATRESAFALISVYPDLLHSFFQVSGCCNKCTHVRLRFLSYKNVRSRFVSYLLYCLQPGETVVEFIHNQMELAEYLNVTRPALSKEVNLMIKEGLISKQDKKFKLLNIPLLKNYVL